LFFLGVWCQPFGPTSINPSSYGIWSLLMTTYSIHSPIENWVQRGTKYGLKERGTILLGLLIPYSCNLLNSIHNIPKAFFSKINLLKRKFQVGEKEKSKPNYLTSTHWRNKKYSQEKFYKQNGSWKGGKNGNLLWQLLEGLLIWNEWNMMGLCIDYSTFWQHSQKATI